MASTVLPPFGMMTVIQLAAARGDVYGSTIFFHVFYACSTSEPLGQVQQCLPSLVILCTSIESSPDFDRSLVSALNAQLPD